MNIKLDNAIKLFEDNEYEQAKNQFLTIDDNQISQYYLGAIYRMGLGVKDDQIEAFSWFLKAAKQGHAESQFLVGCSYIEYTTFMNRETALVKIDYKRLESRSKKDVSIWQDDLPYYELDGLGVTPCSSEGFKWIKKSAEQGYLNAQIALGDIYDWGIGVEEDKNEMRSWYEKAALGGSATAYRKLAFHAYIYDEDFTRTIELLQKAYSLGDLRVSFTIGNRYEHAENKDNHLQEAFKWYNVAAEESNHFKALVKLGDFYQDGIVVEKCIEKSIFYYRKSLEAFNTIYDAGYCIVYEKLFCLYNQGYKEAILDDELTHYLICLADHNDEARLKLKEGYDMGYNVGEKHNVFFRLYDKAIQGDKQSQIKCGYHYLLDNPMDETVKKHAFNWYMDDAIHENPDAQYLIARIHFGRNNKVDYPFWLKKAADNNHSKAQHELALYYEYKRHADSITYMTLAAKSNMVAQILLGYKYGHGEHVELNYKIAFKYYQLAAANMKEITDTNELRNVNRIKFRYNAANDEATRSAKHGDINAQLYMGCLFQYGFEVKRNLKKSTYWYSLALKEGNKEAKKQLTLIKQESC